MGVSVFDILYRDAFFDKMHIVSCEMRWRERGSRLVKRVRSWRSTGKRESTGNFIPSHGALYAGLRHSLLVNKADISAAAIFENFMLLLRLPQLLVGCINLKYLACAFSRRNFEITQPTVTTST
jgi:hypothetical protein